MKPSETTTSSMEKCFCHAILEVHSRRITDSRLKSLFDPKEQLIQKIEKGGSIDDPLKEFPDFDKNSKCSPKLTLRDVRTHMLILGVRSYRITRKELIVYLDYFENTPSRCLKSWIRRKDFSGMIEVLKKTKVMHVDLEDSGMTFEEVAEWFEFGIFRDFKFTTKKITTRISAWIYGDREWFHQRNVSSDIFMIPKELPRISRWNDLLFNTSHFEMYHRTMTPPKIQDKFETDASLEFMFMYEFNAIQFHDLSCKEKERKIELLERVLTTVSSSGIKMDMLTPCGLPIWHLNHYRFLNDRRVVNDSWPDFHYRYASDSSRRYEIPKFIQDRMLVLPYPKFSPDLWGFYPKKIKDLIFTLLCMQKFRRDSFPLSKDILRILLSHAVYESYVDAENKLKKWADLSKQYATVGVDTIIIRALDQRITEEGKTKVQKAPILAARLVALYLGYDNTEYYAQNAAIYKDKNQMRYPVICDRAWYVGHGNTTKTRKLINSDYKDDCSELLYRNTVDKANVMLGECYDNNIALSLIWKGKIDINKENGRIVDLKKAIKLSRLKQEKDRKAFKRLEDAEEPPVKKVRVRKANE